MAPDATKRVRSSQTRYRRFWSARSEISGEWVRAIKAHTPINVVSDRMRERIAKLDLTITLRTDLYAWNDASREMVIHEHAVWCLYIDGQPTTSDAIIAMRAAGDESAWDRVHGRFEWSGSHDPFYDDAAPESLARAHGDK